MASYTSAILAGEAFDLPEIPKPFPTIKA